MNQRQREVMVFQAKRLQVDQRIALAGGNEKLAIEIEKEKDGIIAELYPQRKPSWCKSITQCKNLASK